MQGRSMERTHQVGVRGLADQEEVYHVWPLQSDGGMQDAHLRIVAEDVRVNLLLQ